MNENKDDSSFNWMKAYEEVMQEREDYIRNEHTYLQILYHGSGLEGNESIDVERSRPLRLYIYMLCPAISGNYEDIISLEQKAEYLMEIIRAEKYWSKELFAFGVWLRDTLPEEHLKVLKGKLLEVVDAFFQRSPVHPSASALIKALISPL
jgi:hypothetical protein